MVDLYVGPNREHFQVHEELLCSKIPYFKKCFAADSQKRKQKSAEFLEDNPAAFDALLTWVYRDEIQPLYTLTDETVGGMHGTGAALDFYFLAEMFCLPVLQDRIMDLCIQFSKDKSCLPYHEKIEVVYQKTAESSPMRKFMARTFHFRCNTTTKLIGEELWPLGKSQKLLKECADLSADLLTLLREGTKPSNPLVLDACEFHCHAKGESCSAKKQ